MPRKPGKVTLNANFIQSVKRVSRIQVVYDIVN
jgi:hypothetical protein